MSEALQVLPGHVHTSRETDGLHVDFVRRRDFRRVIAPIWIALVMVYGLVSMPSTAFVLTLWAVFGVVVLGPALWQLLHREALVVGTRSLVHTRTLGPLRRRHEYERSAIANVQLQPERLSVFDPRRSWSAPGSVAFDVNGYTIHVADVDEDVAVRVVDALRGELHQP